MRADIYLTTFGYTESRQKASTYIKNGIVTIDSRKILKPSEEVDEKTEHSVCLELSESDAFVSRGALKLKAAIDAFDLNVKNKICIDIGASTGGFTDCLLSKGATKVYAYDSGKNQLPQKLACDSRVISKEGFNARFITYDDVGELADVVVMDVSFISQTLIIPNIPHLLKDTGFFISLVKPQFEAGKQALGKNGIVKNRGDKLAAIERVSNSANEVGLSPVGIISSPIKGGDGNEEFLIYFVKEKVDENKLTEFKLSARNLVK